jgi:hypothetical protein
MRFGDGMHGLRVYQYVDGCSVGIACADFQAVAVFPVCGLDCGEGLLCSRAALLCPWRPSGRCYGHYAGTVFLPAKLR